MKRKLTAFVIMMVMVLAMAVPAFAATTYTVSGAKNYLALRSTPETRQDNEIGRLNNGEQFYVMDYTRNGFAYGRTAARKYGYVNASYLSTSVPGVNQEKTCVVKGVKNYLALRSTPTRNPDDEIGKLHNGDIFRALQFRSDGYAYGIAPDGKYGYVVSEYLK